MAELLLLTLCSRCTRLTANRSGTCIECLGRSLPSFRLLERRKLERRKLQKKEWEANRNHTRRRGAIT